MLKHLRDTGVHNWPNVRVLEGKWQDFVHGDKLGELLVIAGEGFDAIFMDTFAEGYEGASAIQGADLTTWQSSKLSSRSCRIFWNRKTVYSHSGTA